jgi:CRISPR type I-D/CYANO-associated protein Csc1
MFITICHLTLHDYLFYASREMGRLYETEKYLHNYGLTYALGLTKSPFANLEQIPHYQADLAPVNEQGIYVTPAFPVQHTFAFHTFKMARTSYYTNTAKTSTNQAIFGRAKEITPGSTFEFFVVSEQVITLPTWVRLGKWMAKAHIAIVACQQAQQQDGPFCASGALNPLDITAIPRSCNVISMAPASLITNAHYTGPYYTISVDKREINLPQQMRYLITRQRLSA